MDNKSEHQAKAVLRARFEGLLAGGGTTGVWRNCAIKAHHEFVALMAFGITFLVNELINIEKLRPDQSNATPDPHLKK